MNEDSRFKQERADLLNWPESAVNVLHPWHLPDFNLMPSRQELFAHGMSGIAKGWLPQQPLISASTRTFAIGSCFARNFVVWLAEHGFNQSEERSPYGTLERLMSGFESAAVLAQQFRWAFGEVDASSLLWIDKNREVVEATEEAKLRLRDALLGTDVLIVTLGMSEIWYDQVTGEPLWRSLTRDKYDPERHVFRIESVERTRHWLEVIESLRRRHAPCLKMIYTVSPIPLAATFRPVSAVTANCASKSILRAALDEFLRSHADVVGSEVFYFPSYEFVSTLFASPFQEDNRHITDFVTAKVLAFFAETCCALADARPRTSMEMRENRPLQEALSLARDGHTVTPEQEAWQRIRELEEKVAELDRICAERARVIDELDRAARERLALIEKLESIADERLAGMRELTEIAGQRLAQIRRLESEIDGA